MGETFLKVAGEALLVLVICQMAVMVFASVRRLAADRTTQKLELQLLQQRVEIAKRKLHRQESEVTPWNGFRKFRVQRRAMECDGVCSFYLVPHDRKPLPSFLPGQFLTFQLHVAGETKPVVRCYSLSDRPRPDYYRITVKRIPPPGDRPEIGPGLVSNHLVTSVNEGDILDVKAPSGAFSLDPEHERPVVLVAGGVGLTPVLSMLNHIVEGGSSRETWMFYGVRNSRDHIMREHLEKIAREYANVRLHVCYSDALAGDTVGVTHQHDERATIALMRRILPSSNYDFFICGPGPMMKDIPEGLREWGVQEERIHTEAFQSTSVKKLSLRAEQALQITGLSVTFTRSGRKVQWEGKADSILELAESAGITMDYGCRAGSCGTCKTAIRSGKVAYLKKPGCEVEAGSCLTCICVPETEVILEA